MDVSVAGFLGFLIGVALLRGVELVISRRNQHRLEAQGVSRASEPHFHWMVVLHSAVLAGAALEVLWLNPPFIPVLAILMATLFTLANVLRWWVIRTLGMHWNVQIMDSVSLGVITSGPFRFVRHPNYAAVFIELVALPLIHTAWLTALVGSAGHAWVLSQRLVIEEGVLLRNGEYRATLAHRPRFVPRLFDTRAKQAQLEQRDLSGEREQRS
jgi:methyltransferase